MFTLVISRRGFLEARLGKMLHGLCQLVHLQLLCYLPLFPSSYHRELSFLISNSARAKCGQRRGQWRTGNTDILRMLKAHERCTMDEVDKKEQNLATVLDSPFQVLTCSLTS